MAEREESTPKPVPAPPINRDKFDGYGYTLPAKKRPGGYHPSELDADGNPIDP